MKHGVILAAIVLVSWATATAQGDIKTLVKAVEARYAVHHHGVPGLWIAKPFMIGSGVSGLKMAVFNGFHGSDVRGAEFETILEQNLGREWSPFVSLVSKHERTVIYARPTGSEMVMLFATFEDDGLTLMQMKVGGRAMREWVDEPVQTATDRHRQKDAPSSQSRTQVEALVSSR